MKTAKAPTDYSKKISLQDLSKSTMLYGIAKAKIDHQGFYACIVGGVKTLIVN